MDVTKLMQATTPDGSSGGPAGNRYKRTDLRVHFWLLAIRTTFSRGHRLIPLIGTGSMYSQISPLASSSFL